MRLAPQSLDAVQAAIADSAPAPLAIRGAGTKATARPPDRQVLDLGSLTGIVGYDPAECVITALAGTPVAEVQQTLAAHGQALPFDPPLVAAGATIGGTVAAGLSGSGRHRYGGIRDFVIGARVVDGEGRLLRTGGQVVKNAAGFLLHHALVGSAGRFGAIVEVSFKVFPAPEARRTLAVHSGSRAAAVAAHDTLRTRGRDLEALDLDLRTHTTWARLAGAAAAVEAQARALAALLPADRVDVLDGGDDARLWQDARELAWAGPGRDVVKVVGSPAALSHAAAATDGVGHARSMAGGAALLVALESPVEALAKTLGATARAVVVRGAECGRVLRPGSEAIFAERVRGVLDPGMRFA